MPPDDDVELHGTYYAFDEVVDYSTKVIMTQVYVPDAHEYGSSIMSLANMNVTSMMSSAVTSFSGMASDI